MYAAMMQGNCPKLSLLYMQSPKTPAHTVLYCVVYKKEHKTRKKEIKQKEETEKGGMRVPAFPSVLFCLTFAFTFLLLPDCLPPSFFRKKREKKEGCLFLFLPPVLWRWLLQKREKKEIPRLFPFLSFPFPGTEKKKGEKIPPYTGKGGKT